MNFKTSLFVLLASTVALPVLAQTPAPKDAAATPGVDKRIGNQEKRIDQGVKSGALTAPEAAALQKGEDKIKVDQAVAKADGVVTKPERKQLHQELNRESRAIHRQKHDRQRVHQPAK